jgi:L-ascorbate metabolism protein UlaG (beta-lactamase superfamily)
MSDLKGTTITWLGHATILVKTSAGTTILIDPYIKNNPKFPKGFALPGSIDLILATHGHADHISDLLAVAKGTETTIVGMPELTSWAEKKGTTHSFPMNYGGSYTFSDVTVSMVEAKHSCGITDGDKLVYGGEAAGYVISVDGGPVLYHAGDTSLFSDMALIRELWTPTFGMLPIGGVFTMDPRSAALAVKLLGLKAVLPIHWGTFPVLTGTPREFKEHLGDFNVQVISVEPWVVMH